MAPRFPLVPAVLVGLVFVLPVAGTDPKPKPSLADCLAQLRSDDRQDLLNGVEGLRDHHPDAAVEHLPLLLKAVGRDLDRPFVRHAVGRSHLLGQTALAVIASTGPDGLPAFKTGVRNTDAHVRAGAFWAWRWAAHADPEVDRDDLFRALEKGVTDEDGTVRSTAAEALGLFGTADKRLRTRGVELLVEILKERTAPEVIRERPTPAATAAQALRPYKANALPALPHLMAATKEGGEIDLSGSAARTAGWVARSIGGRTAREVADELFRIATDPDSPPLARVGALMALQESDTTKESRLNVSARAPPEEEKKQALALGKMLAEPNLSPQLRHDALGVLEAMGEGAAPAAVCILERVKVSDDHREQAFACHAWRAMGRKAGPEVTEYLPRWRASVEETLAELEDQPPEKRDRNKIGDYRRMRGLIDVTIQQTK